ncbi:teashirt homolog 1 isoform X3 [Lates japonicus]|uniref:Teashirt homolog 1 isoform X3 n=1 Tax=Lates japonicus TaxID=270547 RepID=A0AAD3NAQ5_LATJO|nr:teashirt homolog 1 isoform X3 [Lates japonicus]
MAARPRAKVTGALAPVQMALLTAITHSANQTARDGTPALPLPEPAPRCWCCSAYVRPGREKELNLPCPRRAKVAPHDEEEHLQDDGLIRRPGQ